jgi:hypothetical protein
VGFGDTVNITLGLPIIRTSVDHGTAFDIAGTGIAHGSNMITATKLGIKMAIGRNAKRRADELQALALAGGTGGMDTPSSMGAAPANMRGTGRPTQKSGGDWTCRNDPLMFGCECCS